MLGAYPLPGRDAMINALIFSNELQEIGDVAYSMNNDEQFAWYTSTSLHRV